MQQEQKIAFVKGRLNFSSKSTTAANVHLMESFLLDNWLKNNHVTVDRILPEGFKGFSALKIPQRFKESSY